ncbi:MAG: HAMP domain-containing sensor histidine kinase [bacterium]
METHYAPPGRSNDNELQREVETASSNAVIDGLLTVVSGLLAVLNEHRQIVALNEQLLEMLGVGDAQEVLGLRLGEAIQCVHADKSPGGCGTTEFCSTCGAAIAIVSSLGLNKSVERTCAVSVEQNGTPRDLFLKVRAAPLTFGETRFILLFLQDISRQQQWVAFERTFFHDLNNLTAGLVGRGELIAYEEGQSVHRIAQEMSQLAIRISREIAIQKSLSRSERPIYDIVSQDFTLDEVCQELHIVFDDHPAANGITLAWPPRIPEAQLRTDLSLVIRILTNMIINALEATETGGEIALNIAADQNTVTFSVWNRAAIPDDVRRRMFQRNYSTKNEDGRGLGTFAMKLFGERILGGKVSFSSSEREGTLFEFRLPR